MDNTSRDLWGCVGTVIAAIITGIVTLIAVGKITLPPFGDPPPTSPPLGYSGILENPNTPLEATGWHYVFTTRCFSSCARVISESSVEFQPQGRLILVVIFLVNNTGKAQPIPQNFFMIKDGQGREYNSLPDVSRDYVIHGVNVDFNEQDKIPLTTNQVSIALFYDVSSDATDLVLFSQDRIDHGWLIMQNVH